MVEGGVFIALLIVALVELVKRGFDRDARGVLIIVMAGVLGGLVGALDTQLGVSQLTIAQGVVYGLDAVGLHTVARQVG